MTATTTDVDVDTSDLDAYDGLIHGYCGYCLPRGPRWPKYGELYTAVCGKPAIAGRQRAHASSPPKSACGQCVVLLDAETCPHGHEWNL